MSPEPRPLGTKWLVAMHLSVGGFDATVTPRVKKHSEKKDQNGSRTDVSHRTHKEADGRKNGPNGNSHAANHSDNQGWKIQHMLAHTEI